MDNPNKDSSEKSLPQGGEIIEVPPTSQPHDSGVGSPPGGDNAASGGGGATAGEDPKLTGDYPTLEAPSYTCNECSNTFDSLRKLFGHLRVHPAPPKPKLNDDEIDQILKEVSEVTITGGGDTAEEVAETTEDQKRERSPEIERVIESGLNIVLPVEEDEESGKHVNEEGAEEDQEEPQKTIPNVE